ncbi:hypothetical protein H4Q26_017116 [Puccinia striiformis f. sp. tritici PST-130]|nr:hypothetical protein H4Q26_017116 [Puccinia striiformis f. sp. tritici PST-130]
MASQLTLTDLLNQSHDPKTNPFTGVISALRNNRIRRWMRHKPEVSSTPHYLQRRVLVCAAIICLPYLQGVGGHQRRHWIIKRQYLDSHGQSYWIPNRYSAFHSGVAADAFYGSACMEHMSLRCIPEWENKSDPSGGLQHQPDRFPLIALVFALVLTSAQVSAMTARSESFRTLLSTLTLISLQWREGQDFAHIHQFSAASAQFHDYTLKSLHLLARFRTTGLFWTLMAVPTFIFYIFGICTLLKVMHKRFQAAKSQPEEQSTTGTDSFGKRLISGHHQDKSSKLRNSFIYLGVHYTMMSMTLFYHIVIGLIFYLSGDAKMTNKDWMQLFMVLSNSGSYLLLAALLVQMPSTKTATTFVITSLHSTIATNHIRGQGTSTQDREVQEKF